MSILILNSTSCSICNNSLKENDDIYSFPAFLQNTKDPMYLFNDSSFHIDCLNNHVLGAEAIELAESFIYATRPSNRICKVGGNSIKSPDDYIFIDVLTTDKREDLYQFNLTTLDRNNLPKWLQKDEFIRVAIEFKKQDKWGDFSSYKYLDGLIEKVSQYKII